MKLNALPEHNVGTNYAITQTILARSAEGQPIELFQPADNASDQQPILFIGGVHGDEPEGVQLANDMLAWLQQLPHAELNSLHPWLLIPCLNPDGCAVNKRTNGNNVDLNRNYPASNWQKAGAKYPDRYYPGETPASEPEIQGLVPLVQKIKPKLIIHFHSWQPCVLYTGESGHSAAKALADVSGYKLTANIDYNTPGSLSDYAYHDLGIPVICLEEQEGIELSSIWPRFRPALTKLLAAKSQEILPNIAP